MKFDSLSLDLAAGHSPRRWENSISMCAAFLNTNLSRTLFRYSLPASKVVGTMKAIVLQGEAGKAALVHDRPYPRSRPGYVLVDVRAVALNPTDWKHIDEANTKGCLVGCDFAGVVAQVGSGYTKDWKVGDRICGFSHGGNELESEDGAFAERVAVKADIAIRIPDSMSFEDAATLGVGVITCGQGLFQQMSLNTLDQPSTKGEYFLVYGGSTATGTLGIQFTKLQVYSLYLFYEIIVTDLFSIALGTHPSQFAPPVTFLSSNRSAPLKLSTTKTPMSWRKSRNTPTTN